MHLVNITSGVCVAGYVSTVIVMLTKCLPIHKNWQVYPYPGDACALNIPNYLALVVTNVTYGPFIPSATTQLATDPYRDNPGPI